MKRYLSGLRTVSMAVLCSCPVMASMPTSVMAQEPPKTAPADGHSHDDESHAGHTHGPSINESAFTPAIKAASDTLREHLKLMRTRAIRFNATDDTIEAKKIQEEWIDLLDKGRKLHQDLVETALKEYEKDPKNNTGAAVMLFSIAARNANVDRFDGMLQVVKTLGANNFNEKTFNLCAGLTAAAHGEFALAAPFLKAADQELSEGIQKLADNPKVPQQQKEKVAKDAYELHLLLEDLGNTEKQQRLWDDELKAREADKAGEPLPVVRIVTSRGAMEVELFENQVPNTVANFVSLCEKGYYDNLPFHRVLTHFMAQGGCPNGDGSGGPDYRLPSELDLPNQRHFFRGTLGMALSANDPHSGGSQFFICYLPRGHLNDHYVAFGRVLTGMDVLSDITHINPEDKDANTGDLPDKIVRTEIIRKRNHPYQPKTMPALKP